MLLFYVIPPVKLIIEINITDNNIDIDTDIP